MGAVAEADDRIAPKTVDNKITANEEDKHQKKPK